MMKLISVQEKIFSVSLSLYDAWISGVVDMDEMVKLTEEYSGIKMVEKDTPTWRSLRRNGQM